MNKLFFLGILLLLAYACTPKIEPVVFGKDFCSFCKMTILDPRFAAEAITKKGKVFKFDDLACLDQYCKVAGLDSHTLHGVYVSDFQKPHMLLPVEEVLLVKAPDLRSPMGGNAAAFAVKDSGLVSTFFKEYARVMWPATISTH